MATSNDAQSPQEHLRVAAELRAIAPASSWFDLGVWSESARLAAKAGDLSFFDSKNPTMRGLTSIVAALEGVGANDQNAADGIIEQFRHMDQRGPRSPNDLTRVAAALDSVITQGGR